MKYDPITPGKRKPVNVSLDENLVAAAREVGVNLSRVTEHALRDAVRAEQRRRWMDENRDAITAFNDWYEREGDPLADLRVR